MAKTRTQVLDSQKTIKDTEPVRIITKFTNQQDKIKSIVSKYWHMLIMDPILR